MSGEKKINILIADDEEGLRFSLASILEMEGYDVKTAEDGASALELVKENDFDIAFFDIRMPGMNGVEALKNIKVASPETVVVIMTAYAMNDLIKEAVREGAFACISKPFEIDDILNTVKEIISKRMALVITSDASVADFFNANFATCGFFVVCESDLNKALRLAERRKPELVFIDAAYRGSASSVSSAAGSYSKVVLIGQDLQESPGAAFKHISLSKSAVSEFLQSDGKKNASIVSGDTINSNNLKLALTAKGYDTSVFNGEDAFFKGRAAGNCDFIIIDSEASADPEKFCSRIRQCGAAGVIIFIFDYNTPLSEELKKLDVLFLQRPFDSKDVIKLMERQ